MDLKILTVPGAIDIIVFLDLFPDGVVSDDCDRILDKPYGEVGNALQFLRENRIIEDHHALPGYINLSKEGREISTYLRAIGSILDRVADTKFVKGG